MLRNARVCASVPTQDLERAKAWYIEKLGLEPIEDLASGVRFRCLEGTEFLLFLSGGKSDGSFTHLGFDVEDVGRGGWFPDPAGNMIGVFQRSRVPAQTG